MPQPAAIAAIETHDLGRSAWVGCFNPAAGEGRRRVPRRSVRTAYRVACSCARRANRSCSPDPTRPDPTSGGQVTIRIDASALPRCARGHGHRAPACVPRVRLWLSLCWAVSLLAGQSGRTGQPVLVRRAAGEDRCSRWLLNHQIDSRDRDSGVDTCPVTVVTTGNRCRHCWCGR